MVKTAHGHLISEAALQGLDLHTGLLISVVILNLLAKFGKVTCLVFA